MPPDRADSIARNAVFAFVVQLTTAAFTAVLTLFLVRALDPQGFGVFALALAVVGLLALPADFGISSAAARFIAERRGDRGAVANILGDALKLKLVTAGFVGLALAAAGRPIAAVYDEPALVWPLRGMALALFGQSVLLLFSASFIAQARTAVNLRVQFAESLVETGASIALVLLGAGASGAAFGRSVGYLFGAAVGLAYAVRILGRSVIARRFRARGSIRDLARYAGALAVVDIAFSVFEQIDALVIGAYLTARSVGLFQAPVRLVALFYYPGYAVANAVAPRLARGRDEAPNVAAFERALRYLLVFQAAVTVGAVVWAGPIVELVLGDRYERSASVLRALGPFIFLSGIGPLLSLGANYLGQARLRIPAAVTAVALNVAIDVVLIPRIGIVAGAIGTDVAYGVYVATHVWICARVIDVSWRPLVLSLVRTALAAGAMAGVLLVAGTSSLSLAEWVAGSAGAALAYVLVLVVVGEVRPSELGLLWSAVKRGLRFA